MVPLGRSRHSSGLVVLATVGQGYQASTQVGRIMTDAEVAKFLNFPTYMDFSGREDLGLPAFNSAEIVKLARHAVDLKDRLAKSQGKAKKLTKALKHADEVLALMEAKKYGDGSAMADRVMSGMASNLRAEVTTTLDLLKEE